MSSSLIFKEKNYQYQKVISKLYIIINKHDDNYYVLF